VALDDPERLVLLALLDPAGQDPQHSACAAAEGMLRQDPVTPAHATFRGEDFLGRAACAFRCDAGK
jgi:hypothetical protein